MPMDPRVSAGVAVMVTRTRNGIEELLMLRRKGKHAAGLLSCPGGWIDYGESPEDAARRELAEETGLDLCHSMALVGIRHNVFAEQGFQSVTLHYRTVWSGEEPANLEPEKCSEMFWLSAAGPWPAEEEFFPGLYSLLLEVIPRVETEAERKEGLRRKLAAIMADETIDQVAAEARS